MSRIFLVDDHALVREGMRGVLEQAGHRVVGEAADPTAAIDGLRRLEVDIALVDIHLGHHSGLDLLQELRARSLAVRCIMLTMSAQQRHVAEALRSGAAGYVLKGSASATLLQAIAEVANGRTYLGADVAHLAVAGLLAAPGDDAADVLSPRERQIVAGVVRGRSSAAIAEELHLSPKTVETYRSRVMAKLGVGDVPALVRWAIRHGLIALDDD
jgi:two-component system, NarL family, invasion response regulator UvrY